MEIRKEDVEATKIISTIDGILMRKFQEEGEVAKSAEKIADILGVDKVRVLVHIDMARLRRITEGMQVHVACLDKRGKSITRTGTVLSIDNSVDPASQTIGIKVEVENKDGAIMPGIRATVTFK